MAKFLQTNKVGEEKDIRININLDHVLYATAFSETISELTLITGETIMVNQPLREIV